jgi:hypothetical protein
MKPELGDKQRLLHIRDAILLIEQFLETLDEMHFQQSAPYTGQLLNGNLKLLVKPPMPFLKP